MTTELQDLQAFLAVVRAGGFRQAARSGGDSASKLSEAVRRLETYFVAEQVGVPAICDQLYVFGGGPTDDDHAFHEFQGLRAATAEEIVSLPLWGGLRDLMCRFLRTGGNWDCSLSPNCF